MVFQYLKAIAIEKFWFFNNMLVSGKHCYKYFTVKEISIKIKIKIIIKILFYFTCTFYI